MEPTARQRATQAYRSRLARKGMTRFEIQAPAGDRELLRALARRLAETGPAALSVRAQVVRIVSGEPPQPPPGILAALRRSPMVGAGLELARHPQETIERRIDL